MNIQIKDSAKNIFYVSLPFICKQHIWRCRHCIPVKLGEMLTQRHRITWSQKTWILDDVAVETSNLVIYVLFDYYSFLLEAAVSQPDSW